MSDEPRTHKLDAHELLKFLDQLAPDVEEEQRAQLVFVDQRVQRLDASADAPALRMPSSHPFAQARLAQVKPPHEPARERPLELTMLDAERVIDAELLGLRWGGRSLRRAVIGGAAGLALLALLAFAAVRSRDPHASGARPPPLPQPSSLATKPPAVEPRPRVGSGGGSSSAEHSTTAATIPRDAEPEARSALAHASADEVPAPSHDAQPGSATAIGERALPALNAAGRLRAGASAAATPTLPPGRAPASSPTMRAGAGEDHALPLGSRRRAVDLLLAGESRAALDAYRALTQAGAADPAFAQVVHLLELELSSCGPGEAASCRQ